jgi:hypothetical protein
MNQTPRVVLLTLLAVVGAGVLTFTGSTPSYEDQLIGLAVGQAFGDTAPRIEAEPAEVQALLLDYADNEALVLKARSALLRYPDLARRILPVYGAELEFQDVLLRYGEAALLPIGYYMDHDLTSLEIRRALGERWNDVAAYFSRLVGRPAEAAASGPALTPELRGWYAVNFIREGGHGFLGQFAVTPDGKIEWVQTERVLEGLGDLFLGGIRDLETKWRLGEEILASDLGWAALDVAVLATSVKLLKAVRATKLAGPAAEATRVGGFSRKVALFGSRVLAGGGRLAARVARFGAVPAAIYLMFRYPSLANATLTELAGWLGVAPWMLQLPFWLVVLYVVLRLGLALLSPLSHFLRGLASGTARAADWARPARVRAGAKTIAAASSADA